jgi:predicted transposase YbfD/YdcC
MLKTERTHWQIENYFQWVLDLAFREDDCRIRKDNGDPNCAILLSVLMTLKFPVFGS